MTGILIVKYVDNGGHHAEKTIRLPFPTGEEAFQTNHAVSES